MPRAIFRETALEAYRRRSERDVVPRLASTPIILCAWLLLAALLAAALIAWSVRVPAYVGATGLVTRDATTAVLFVPRPLAADVRSGQRAQVRIGASATSVPGRVAKVEPGLVGPADARRRYGAASAITEPAAAVVVRLRRHLSPAAYGGSRVTARVQTGAQRLAALLPGLGPLG